MLVLRNHKLPLHAARAFFPLLVGISTGCGGSSSEPRPTAEEGPDAGVDPFDCDADEGLELSMLQDFEKGVATHFYTNSDGTEGSVVEPPAGSSSPAAADIEGGRCGTSSRAFRMTGEGLRIWGMVFGWNFRDGTRDLSDWDGISFWARRGSVDSGRSLFFSVFDPLTDSGSQFSEHQCDSESEVLSEKCDAYGTGVGLDEEWRFFAIPFSALRQRGFGVATDQLNVEEIIGFNWAADRGEWEVWLDDVALFRRPDDGVGGAGGGEN